MLRIHCPYCGVRDHEEFSYFGDATKHYPGLEAEHHDGEDQPAQPRPARRRQRQV